MYLELYEDKDGSRLFLKTPTVIWGDIEGTDSTFRADARAIEEENTGDWNLNRVPNALLKEMNLIATYSDHHIWSAPRLSRIARNYIFD